MRYLVIANRTLGGAHLHEHLHALNAAQPSQFHVLVPATAAPGTWSTTEAEEYRAAQERLDATLASLHDAGLDAGGQVTDPHPVAAALDALREREYEQIIVSTLPAGISRWLGLDLPSRLERATGLPVTHLIAEPARQ